jgi:hypothetical protein
MKIIKVVLLLLIVILVNTTVANAGLIRTTDGQRIERSDLPSVTETVLEYDNDQLIGAFNVNVVGVGIFDVDFIDQAFNTISDFDLVATAQTVDAFTTALISDVFIDVGGFLFDDIPSLTLGCETASVCFAFVPHTVSASGSAVFVGSAVNQSLASSQPDRIETTVVSSSNDLSVASGAVFARFFGAPTRVAPPTFNLLAANTPAPQDVSEPSSIFIALIGMVGIALYRRKPLSSLC